MQGLGKPQKRGRGFVDEGKRKERQSEEEEEEEACNHCNGATTVKLTHVSILMPTSSEGRS